MSGIKPVYQWQHSNSGVLPESWWKDCTEEDFKARDNKMQFNVRIMFETTAVIESLRRDNEALQKENAQWKTVLDCNEQIRVAQAKRIEELESELFEWNEFKKIRDMQMQALRKQMP